MKKKEKRKSPMRLIIGNKIFKETGKKRKKTMMMIEKKKTYHDANG